MLTCLLYLTVAAAPSTKTPDVLPLRKLRLYETGVGYFERRGGVRANAELALPLPAAHLDDALKSLVILDASGDTRVQGLKFASAVSESGARAMAGLSQVDESVGYVDVLESLEGAEIDVRHADGRVVGTLLDVEGPFGIIATDEDKKAPGPPPEPWHAVVLVDDDGGIHRVRTDAITSVRAIDADMQNRLKVAADAISDQSARRSHPLGVDVSSTGQIGLGYISEAPVWRTTYRVVLPDSGDQAELQAWALVHNDTDEDWRKVGLELANGRPQSFLYPLAAPRYAYRELTGPDESLSTVPQLATETVDRMWGDGDAAYGVSGLGHGGGGNGEGTIGLGNVGLIGRGGGGGTSSMGPRVGDLAALSQAAGEESGSLFIYKVTDPLDLDAHHSALVPVIQQTVEAESITWFPRDGSEALSGARVVNTTDQTLPGGVVALFGDGGFVGESGLHRLKPKERQFLVFGTEQDVEIQRTRKRLEDVVVDLAYVNDMLVASVIHKSEHTIRLSNRSGRSRSVYAALNIMNNADIDGEVELDYDLDSGSALAIVDVAGGGEETRSFTVSEGGTERFRPDSEPRLRQLVKEERVPQAKRAALQRSLAHRVEAAAATKEVDDLRSRLSREENELDRLRADLDALGRVRLRGRVAKKLARKLLETEQRVEGLRDGIKDSREEASRQHRLAVAELSALSTVD